MVDISKQEVNKKYDTFEVIGLTFNLLNRNMWQVFKYIAKTVIALFIIIIPVIMMIASLGILESGIFNAYHEPSEFIDMFFALGVSTVAIITIVLFVVYNYTINWFRIRGVVGIDTGIESIESKKVPVPAGLSYIKLFAIQIIVSIVSFGLSLFSSLSSSFLLIYFSILIQITIASFLLDTCTTFSCFEIVAKGKGIFNSLSNAVINLFFSKSGIMLNSILGNLILGIIIFVVTFGVVFFGTITVIFLAYAEVYVLAVITGIILTLLGLVITGYLSFFITTYSYLLYMLNEVKDDRVDSIK